MSELPDQIVNYVWINERKFKPDLDDKSSPLCGVPLHYIDRAIHNAKRYPEVKFNIWVDWRFLDQSSKFFLESHVYFANCSNISVRDLTDIPSYAIECDFAPNVEKDIWAKVDYARLLVLEYMLNKNPDAQIFYSDFDINDIFANKNEIGYSLKNFGLVLAYVEGYGYENSAIGFSVKGGEVLKILSDITKKPFGMDCEGYTEILTVLKQYGLWKNVHDIAVIDAPETGEEMPQNRLYQSLNLC